MFVIHRTLLNKEKKTDRRQNRTGKQKKLKKAWISKRITRAHADAIMRTSSPFL